MITRNFIEEIHFLFDVFGYYENSKLDKNKFIACATKTITHMTDLSSAITLLSKFNYCLKNWDKIQIVFSEKLHIFNEYKYEKTYGFEKLSNSESFGVYIITNMLDKKFDQIKFASHSFDDELMDFDNVNGKLFAFDDGEYYIKNNSFLGYSVDLYNNVDKKICTIKINTEGNILFENNISPYKIISEDNNHYIFNKSDIKSVNNKDVIESDDFLATFNFMFDKNQDFRGAAYLLVYDDDFEFFILVAAASLLLMHKHSDGINLLRFSAILRNLRRF